MHLLVLIGIAATVFASTNIDDVFILLMFLSDRRFTAPQVVAGQYLGIGALVAISVVGSLVSLVIPLAWIGLLGIFPLGIGLMKLYQLWMASDEEEEGTADLAAGYSNILMVAGVTFANGGDNLGVYIPLFATYALWEVAVMVGVFLVLVAVWCAAAWYLIEHPQTGHLVKRYGHVLLPFVLIGLGIWILSNALPLILPIAQS